MPLVYSDAYLVKFCTPDREARAFAEVDSLGTFPEAWRNRLATLKCYVLACLENQAEPDDLFAAKLKAYRVEFDSVLVGARGAAPDEEGNVLPVFSVPIERA